MHEQAEAARRQLSESDRCEDSSYGKEAPADTTKTPGSTSQSVEEVSEPQDTEGPLAAGLEEEQRVASSVERPPTTNRIAVKVRDHEGEDALFTIKRDSSLRKLMRKYAERAGVNVSALRFFFEGNSIVDIHTPNELEMEDGDVIDASITAVSTHTGSTSSILCEASSQEQEQEGEQEPPLASAAACVILQPTDTTKASGAASQPVDEVSEPQATEEQLAAGQQLQQQQLQAQQQQQRLLQQQQRQQRQQAASSGLRAGKCPALDVRVEWVVAQTPQWRGVVRAKLDQLMEQKRQHEAARLREEQAMQQQQRRQQQRRQQQQQQAVQATTVRVKCPAGVSAGQPLRVRFDDREFDIIVRQQQSPRSIDASVGIGYGPLTLPVHACMLTNERTA
eukprot:COSAG06_NODE_1568_length_9074_cov_5.196212_4_plen_393_part_00